MAPTAAPETVTYFNNEELSDIRIRFGVKEIFAHRYVLCRNSIYFRTLLTGAFAEKGKDVIELKDDHSPSVSAMLRHIYGLCYRPPIEAEVKNGAGALLPYARVYVVAEKYGAEDLKAAMTNRLSSGGMFYSGDWTEYCEDIDASIRLIFSHTPTADKRFRPALISICAANMQSWGCEDSREDFERLLAETPDFATAVIMQLSQTLGTTVQIYTCPNCGHRRTEDTCTNTFAAALKQCPECDLAYDHDDILKEQSWQTFQVNELLQCDLNMEMVDAIDVPRIY
ncbi:hypothetical protein LTR95_014747 [Oleoguttula sp. CCFEE 5521]